MEGWCKSLSNKSDNSSPPHPPPGVWVPSAETKKEGVCKVGRASPLHHCSLSGGLCGLCSLPVPRPADPAPCAAARTTRPRCKFDPQALPESPSKTPVLSGYSPNSLAWDAGLNPATQPRFPESGFSLAPPTSFTWIWLVLQGLLSPPHPQFPRSRPAHWSVST